MNGRIGGALAVWRARSDRWAVPVLVAGLLAAIGFNLARWPRDVRRAQTLRRLAYAQCNPVCPAPDVSILVAAWNECAVIDRHVQSVRALRYPNLEHIVCAGGDDGTYELLTADQRRGLVLLRQHSGEGKQGALRRCLEVATGVVVVLTDADCVLEDTSFEQLLHPIVFDAEEATTGIFRPLPEQMTNTFVVHRWAATTYRFLQAHEYVEGLTGANSAIRTTALRNSGALNEPSWIGEDAHLAGRLVQMRHKIRFVGHSEMAVQFQERFMQHARQRSRWLGGILLHAIPRGDWHQAGVVTIFYAVGQVFLWLPLAVPLVGRGALAVWGGGVACAILNRLRYLAFTSARSGVSMNPGVFLASLFLAPLDLVALAYAPLDLLIRLRTKQW